MQDTVWGYHSPYKQIGYVFVVSVFCLYHFIFVLSVLFVKAFLYQATEIGYVVFESTCPSVRRSARLFFRLTVRLSVVHNCLSLHLLSLCHEQDKSSDVEQQPPFGDRKYSNTLPKKRGKIQNQRDVWLRTAWCQNTFHKLDPRSYHHGRGYSAYIAKFIVWAITSYCHAWDRLYLKKSVVYGKSVCHYLDLKDEGHT